MSSREIYPSLEYGNTDRTLQIEADFAQAASLIRWRETEQDDWRGTPFQVADAHHNPHEAIDLVATWLDNA